MINLVENFGRNEVLDAIWYTSILGKDIEDLTVRDILGPVGDLNSIGQLIFGKYRLVLACSNQEPSLADHFSTDKELADFIQKNKDELPVLALKKYSDYIYVLNVKTVQYNHDLHNRFITREQLTDALTVYMPLIQKFMIAAITNTLKIEEQD